MTTTQRLFCAIVAILNLASLAIVALAWLGSREGN